MTQSPECFIGQPHGPHAWRKEALVAGAEAEWMSCDGFGLPPQALKIEALKERALEIYEESQCGGAGCCGNIDGALDYLIKELGK